MNAPADLMPLVAIAGNPNAGKSALFNALTGARQRIGNYPGVTVERKLGRISLPDGRPAQLVDLPGSYSLDPGSLDEEVTRNVLLGHQQSMQVPDAIIAVVDASNLENHLRFALELKSLGKPMIIALNMVDMAERDGLELSPEILAQEMGVPVISTVAVRKRGLSELLAALDDALQMPQANSDHAPIDAKQLAARARELAAKAITGETAMRQTTQMLDRILLHPIGGVMILFGLLFLMFQAVFAWSDAPIGWIEGGFDWLGGLVTSVLPDGFL